MTSQILPHAPEPAPVERLTYSVEESAMALGVSRPTIYRLLTRRILRPVPGIRHKRIPCQQIRRLVATPGELHGVN
jgi:excisionase family DNA binding protein